MKALLLLGLALALGGVAAYMVSSSMNQPVASSEVPVVLETRPVVVAAADLPVGTTLDRAHLRIAEFPVDTFPANSYQSIDQVFEGDIPVVMIGMQQREVILPQRLSIGVLRRGITARIPDGFRAIAIPVNDVRGVGGFVLPGDRVDVLHTTSIGRKDEKPVTRTLLEGINVLGVDQRSSENQEEPVVVKVVTLLADPEQAKALTLAQQVGHLTLSLRNVGDDGEDDSVTVALSDLWNYDSGETPESRAASTQQTSPRMINVIRGLKIDEESVSRSESRTSSVVTN
jgi:pilus assembly protein CpaB